MLPFLSHSLQQGCPCPGWLRLPRCRPWTGYFSGGHLLGLLPLTALCGLEGLNISFAGETGTEKNPKAHESSLSVEVEWLFQKVHCGVRLAPGEFGANPQVPPPSSLALSPALGL